MKVESLSMVLLTIIDILLNISDLELVESKTVSTHRRVKRDEKPQKAEYVKVLHDLFGIYDKSNRNVIYAPGALEFVSPGHIQKPRDTFLHHDNSLKQSNLPLTTNTKIKEKKLRENLIGQSKTFGLTGVRLLGNLFSVAEKLEKQSPNIDYTNRNQIQILDSHQDLPSVPFPHEFNKNRWKNTAKKKSWLRDLKVAKERKTVQKRSKRLKKSDRLAMEQKLIQPRLEFNSVAERKDQEKKLMEMITLGLHPMQQPISVSQSKGSSDNGGNNKDEDAKSEVPGLHSLQAFSKQDANEWISLDNDPKRPIGFELLEPSADSFLNSVNSLRQKKSSDKKFINKPVFSELKNSILQPSNGESIIFDQPIIVSNELPSKLEDQILKTRSAKVQPIVQPSLKLVKDPPKDFGLINGIDGHPNIQNYFSGPDKIAKEIDYVGLSFLKSPEVTRHPIRNDFVFAKSLKRHFKIDMRQYQSLDAIRKPYPSSQTLDINDKFPLNISTLPTLELTVNHLPIATYTSNLKSAKNYRIPSVLSRNRLRSDNHRSHLPSEWESNFILPGFSHFLSDHNSGQEKTPLVDWKDRTFQTISEAVSTNFTQQFKPMLDALLIASEQNTKHSPRAVPLLVSRSRSIPLADQKRRENNDKSNTSSSRFSSMLNISNRRNGSLLPQKQNWGFSNRNIIPVRLN